MGKLKNQKIEKREEEWSEDAQRMIEQDWSTLESTRSKCPCEYGICSECDYRDEV